MFTILNDFCTKGTYIYFVKAGPIKGNKTNRYQVQSGVETCNILGYIKWYGPWRKYCYFPEKNTVYEQVCLREIAEFCEQETRKYKQK